VRTVVLVRTCVRRQQMAKADMWVLWRWEICGASTCNLECGIAGGSAAVKAWAWQQQPNHLLPPSTCPHAAINKGPQPAALTLFGQPEVEAGAPAKMASSRGNSSGLDSLLSGVGGVGDAFSKPTMADLKGRRSQRTPVQASALTATSGTWAAPANGSPARPVGPTGAPSGAPFAVEHLDAVVKSRSSPPTLAQQRCACSPPLPPPLALPQGVPARAGCRCCKVTHHLHPCCRHLLDCRPPHTSASGSSLASMDSRPSSVAAGEQPQPACCLSRFAGNSPDQDLLVQQCCCCCHKFLAEHQPPRFSCLPACLSNACCLPPTGPQACLTTCLVACPAVAATSPCAQPH
jgi:hypothetical protein